MKLAVIGAGSWGTAIAHLLGSKGFAVSFWARSEVVAQAINTTHVNPRYLNSAHLSHNITATSSFETCLKGCDAIVVVTPSAALRETAQGIASFVAPGTPLVVCSKGAEEGTALLPVEIFEQELGNSERLAVLSGPNHAEEVVQGIPSGTVVASASNETALFFQDLFAADTFRVYTSSDVIGVELCAASKNVVAISCGISYGLGFGDNTAATLMTRGLAEMGRLVESAGGSKITCMGLAGMGDLVVTCSSRHSRNRRLGEMLAAGKTLEDFTNETNMVAEGALACRTLKPLAVQGGVDMPILDAVRSILWEGADVSTTVQALLQRPLRQEFKWE